MRMLASLRKAALFLLAVAIVTAGCSSASTVDAYVEEIEGVASAYVTEAQGLSYAYQSGVEDGVRELVETSDDPVDEAVGFVKAETMNYLVLLEDAMQRYAKALESIDPPAAVAEEHDAYLAAVRSVLASLPDTRTSITESESLDDVAFALGASGFSDGQARWTATCLALEQAVRDEGKGLDLKCEPTTAVEGQGS